MVAKVRKVTKWAWLPQPTQLFIQGQWWSILRTQRLPLNTQNVDNVHENCSYTYICDNDVTWELCTNYRLCKIAWVSHGSCYPKTTWNSLNLNTYNTLTGTQSLGKYPGPWAMADKKLYNVKPARVMKHKVFKSPVELFPGHSKLLQCIVMPVTHFIIPVTIF